MDKNLIKVVEYRTFGLVMVCRMEVRKRIRKDMLACFF